MQTLMTTGSRTSRAAARLSDWIQSLSPTIRPAAYGALFVVLFMLMQGAWWVAPIVVVYVLLTSKSPAATIGLGVAIIALAMAGGAASGLAYGLVGRRLKVAFRGGRYPAGIVTIAPYMFVLPLIVRLAHHKPFFGALTGEEAAIAAGMSVLFGLVMGGSWFKPDHPDERQKATAAKA